MKKILLTLITLFVMTGAAFALDVKDVAKKFESFYKSGSYIKSIDTEEGTIRYYSKQHLTRFIINELRIVIGTDEDHVDTYYDDEDECEIISNVYLLDGNLIIEWHEE